MDKIIIGVTGTGSLFGQAIIKSLKHSRHKDAYCVGFDYFPDTVGSFWVPKNYLLPDFLKKGVKEKDWLDEIIRIINLEHIAVIFIGVEFELPLFANYKQMIQEQTGCKVLVSDRKVIDIANDKYLTFKFLKENNFHYPKTLLPEEINNDEIVFPCIVKPRKGCRSRDTYIVADRHELENKLSMVKEPIIQELIGAPSEEYTCGIIFFDGDVKEIIVLRRTLKDGNTDTAYFDKNIPKIIYEYVYNIANKLKPYGACNFQLRLDKSGIPKLFEINARHSGTTYMRALFGFNEVEYILSYLLGFKVKQFVLKEGIVKRYYDELFIGTE